MWNVTPPYIHALHYVNKIYAHLWCKTFEYVASNHNMLQEQNETGTVKQPKPRTKAAASAPILNQQTLVEIRVCSFFRYGNADLSLGFFWKIQRKRLSGITKSKRDNCNFSKQDIRLYIFNLQENAPMLSNPRPKKRPDPLFNKSPKYCTRNFFVEIGNFYIH